MIYTFNGFVTSPLLEKHFTGYPFNNLLFLKLHYLSINSFKLVVQSILVLISRPGKQPTTLARANLLVLSLTSNSFYHQSTNPPSILAIVLLMMPLKFGMSCLLMFDQHALLSLFEKNLNRTCSPKHSLHNFILIPQALRGVDPGYG